MIATIMIAAASGVVGVSAGVILMGLLFGRKLEAVREARDIALDTLKRADAAFDRLTHDYEVVSTQYEKLAAAENARQAPLRDANAKRRADAAAKVGA